MQINTVMKRSVITIEEGAPLQQARALMEQRGVKNLPVVRGETLVGMLFDRDMWRASASTILSLARHDRQVLLDRLRVTEVMTRTVATLTPDTTIHEAAQLMGERQIGSIPVVEAGKVVGIVTASDLLTVLIGLLEEQRPTGFGEVLVATELGESAGQAIAAGRELARQNGAWLTVLCVLSPGRRVTEAGGIPLGRPARITQQRKLAAVGRLAALLPRDDGEQVVCEVTVGDPVDEIVKAAVRFDADLIIMEPFNPRGLGRFWKRDVVEKIIRDAPCPVLVVKGPRRDHYASRRADATRCDHDRA